MVDKQRHSDRPKIGSKVILCIEVVIDHTDPHEFVQLLVSIPGRESHATRTWATPGGRLDAPVAQDLVTAVEGCVLESLMLHLGIQQRLEAID
jgi:hypothetical protein